MEALLKQLELDYTFSIHFFIFFAAFFALSQLYLIPFQRMLETRYQKISKDLELAERLANQAVAKLDEHRRRMQEAKQLAQSEYEVWVASAKSQELQILTQAKNQAKQLKTASLEQLQDTQAELIAQLEVQVTPLAQAMAEPFLLPESAAR